MVSAVTQDDLDKLKRDMLESMAPAWVQSEVERLRGWRKQLEADDAFGNIMGSTQWVGGASIVDGTVSGRKFTAEVVISSLFQTAESPSDRWELDPAGIRQYATVSGVPNQKIVDINSAGFQFGTSGNNVISFNAATGVLSAPGLQTTSLSISQITSGVVGGTYDTSLANPKVQLSPNGLRAFNSSGTQTVNIAGNTGNVTISGVFEISSAAIGDRIQLKDTGIELWRNGTRQFYLAQGSSNAIQMLLTGPSASQYIGMQPDTGFWMGASTYGAAPFRVSAVGAMQAIGGVFMSAAGNPRVELTPSGFNAYNAVGTNTVSISGSSSTITGGLIRTAASGSRVELDTSGLYGYSGGTQVFKVGVDGTGFLGGATGLTWSGSSYSINGSAIITNSVDGAKLISSSVGSSKIASAAIGNAHLQTAAVGTANIQSAAVGDAQIGSVSANKITTGSLTSTIITIGSGGQIQDADGSFWNQAGITLVGNGSNTDVLTFRTGATTRGYVYTTEQGVDPGPGLVLRAGSSPYGYVWAGSTGVFVGYTGSSAGIGVYASGVAFSGTASNNPAAWPTGGAPTSLIMSTDAGASLLSVQAGYVQVLINGVARKLLFVA